MKYSAYSLGKPLFDATISKLAQLLPALLAERVVQTFDKVEIYQPCLPQNFTELPATLTEAMQQPVSYRPTHIFELRNVNVSWDGALFRNLRLFVPSIVHRRFISRFQDTFLLRQWLGNRTSLPSDEPVLLVAHDQWSTSNYYHWLVDTLPRLLRARETGLDAVLLLPQPLPPKQIADYIMLSAQALGFHKFFPLPTTQILHAKRVLLPELTAESLYHNPALIRQVKQELLDKLNPKAQAPTRRVYASRSTQSVRRLINETAIADLLRSYGFETVFFEQLSFIGQIQLMQETAIFVGIHGANMTNLLFLPPTAAVVELLNDQVGDLCYFRLASCVQQPYYCVPCAPTEEALHNQSDLVADVDFLKRTLDSLL